VVAILAATAAAAAAGGALGATPTATLSESINAGVRSLTVSPTSVSICSPASPLSPPNGRCRGGPVTVTNGPVGGHIDVAGADAAPSDGSGNGWVVCGSVSAPACTGPPVDPSNPRSQIYPGQNQYLEGVGQLYSGDGNLYGVDLSNTPECDQSWRPPSFSCAVSAGETGNEVITVVAPSASTDQSPTFTTSITWTAVP
jgi:hypothetical protein